MRFPVELTQGVRALAVARWLHESATCPVCKAQQPVERVEVADALADEAGMNLLARHALGAELGDEPRAFVFIDSSGMSENVVPFDYAVYQQYLQQHLPHAQAEAEAEASSRFLASLGSSRFPTVLTTRQSTRGPAQTQSARQAAEAASKRRRILHVLGVFALWLIASLVMVDRLGKVIPEP
jgi:hypothetical protein